MTTIKPQHANTRVLWQLALLYITTCGLYFFYWFYKTNVQLYGHQQMDIKPFWRTLGLLVPLLNIYLLWKLFSDIKIFADKASIPAYSSASLITLIFVLCSALYYLPNLYSFLGFFSVLPILFIQQTLNRYWKKEQAHMPEKTSLSWPEIIICILGTILLILALIGAGLSPIQD